MANPISTARKVYRWGMAGITGCSCLGLLMVMLLAAAFFGIIPSSGGASTGPSSGPTNGGVGTCLTPLTPKINDPAGLAAAINKYIASRGQNPFIGLGASIVDTSIKEGVNPILIVAILQKESGFGTGGGVSGVPGGHNAFGQSRIDPYPYFVYSVGPGQPSEWFKWSSWQDSVDDSVDPSTISQEYWIKTAYIDKWGLTDLRAFTDKYNYPPSQSYYDDIVGIMNAVIAMAGSSIDCSAGGSGSGGGPPPSGTAAQLAQQILDHLKDGKYRCDNPGDCTDLQYTAAGKSLNGVGNCHVDAIGVDVLQTILTLINNGYSIGTYALCSDHSDGTSRHVQGEAVDIDSINGVFVDNVASEPAVLQLLKYYNGLIGTPQAPDQLLNQGVGYKYFAANDALSMNNHTSSPYFTSKYVGDHKNHIHVGY